MGSRRANDLIEEFRLAAGGSLVILSASGRELFRVRDGDPAVLMEGEESGGSDPNTPTTDQKAALDGASAPDGSNAFATVNDLPLPPEAQTLAATLLVGNDTGNVSIVAKDGEVIRALVDVDSAGSATLQVNDAAGVMASRLLLQEDLLKWQNADGSLGVEISDGSILMNNGDLEFAIDANSRITIGNEGNGPRLRIEADGTIALRNADESGSIGIGTTGGVTVSASGPFEVSGTAVLLHLPTADPVVAGALWNDTGTVKVSAG